MRDTRTITKTESYSTRFINHDETRFEKLAFSLILFVLVRPFEFENTIPQRKDVYFIFTLCAKH